MDAEIKSMNRKYETILLGEDMKKCCISMWSVVVLSLGLFSCGGGANQQAEAEEKLEVEAVIAGDVARNMLTDELKMEVTQFLKDMPISDLVYQLATGEVQVALANTDFMLPVSRVSDLNTRAQQARACGIYFADMNVLKVLGKPTAEVEQVLLQLTTDLNVPFVVDVMGTEVPEHATREELSHFMKQQEDKLIDVMMENDKADLEIEFLGGLAVEYAYILANPGLSIQGDATTAGLTTNMAKRLDVLIDITKDLAQFYPDMTELGQIIAPLRQMTTSVETAREHQKDIEAMRASLLK